jgi:hypothetical protein
MLIEEADKMRLREERKRKGKIKPDWRDEST